MAPSTVGAHTAAAWRRWDDRNASVGRNGEVHLARETFPTYASGHEVPSDAGSILDVAVAPDGGCYALDEAGVVYRYDAGRGELRSLSCLWEATGVPRALCVTRETIYLAGGGRIQAIARRPLQTRWVASTGVSEPIALAVSGEEVFLLDGGDDEGGFVSRVGRRGSVQPVVTGLLTPRDLAIGHDGTVAVLEAVPDGDAVVGLQPVCRRFDAATLTPGSPVDATDSVWIAPAGFRIRGRAGSVTPTCIALGPSGEVLVGIDPDLDGEKTLLRYSRRDGAFVEQSGLEAGCVALAASASSADRSTVYAIDEDGRFRILKGAVHTRPHPETGTYRGELVMRFDAGEAGIQWDDIELEFALEGSETAVGVRYAATDAAFPPPPDPDDESATAVDSIHGIGPTYAARLEASGIETVTDLAELSVEAARTIVSVEERDVSIATAADWIDAAREVLAGEADRTLQAVDGIGPTYAARLRAAGIDDLTALVGRTPVTVARLTSAGSLDVPRARVAEWIRIARDLREDARTYAEVEWRRVTPANPRKALLREATGRYLWVELELVGTDRESPTVSAFRATFPRKSAIEHLPSIYRENRESAAFLERYLALFESVFDDVETGIAALTQYMDPQGIPAEAGHIAWLGEWLAVGVRDGWPEGAAREFMARAPELYRMRGTRRGLLSAIDIYLEHVDVPRRSWERARAREAAHLEGLVAAGTLTDAEAERAIRAHEALADADSAVLVTVLEYAEVDSITADAARNPYERLIGCPEGFLVLVHPAVADAHVEAISRIVSSHQPAHASGRTIGLDRRIQLTGERSGGLGHHTYLGVNSELAERTFALGDVALGRETVLRGREPDGQLDLQARLGEDARLS